MTKSIPASKIGSLIHFIRDQRVILDNDLAALYGVPTKALNQAVKRNCKKFPADFAFQLTRTEWEGLRSQFVTLKGHRGQHRKYLPYVFSEHGALQAANILSSDHASAISIYVIRAFIKMRENQAANNAILIRLAEIDKTLLLHDTALRDIYQKLRPLLAPPPTPPKPEIGFHVKEDALPYRVRRKPARELLGGRRTA
jgi:hypothetical protein